MSAIYQLVHDLKCKYARPAKVAVRYPVGGHGEGFFTGSWLGAVKAALPGEAWPEFNGVPMHGIAQIACNELPYRPQQLRDVGLICVYLQADENGLHPLDAPLGSGEANIGWCVRTYVAGEYERLVRVEPPRPPVCEAMRVRWELVIDDMPAEDDAEAADVKAFEQTGLAWFRVLKTYGETKVGGWPGTYHGPLTWSQGTEIHPANPEFVFQVASTLELKGFLFDDGGTIFFGRNPRVKDDPWRMGFHSC